MYSYNSENNNSNVTDHPPVSILIFIDTKNVGKLIGKGGSQIRALETESNAKITVSNKKNSCYINHI